MQAHPTAMLSPGRAEGTPDYPGLFCSRAWTMADGNCRFFGRLGGP
jgi:hypothetical protein